MLSKKECYSLIRYIAATAFLTGVCIGFLLYGYLDIGMYEVRVLE